MRRQAGFSLLEVIVAFLVFALIATVVLAIVSRGLTGAEQTAQYQHAVMLAESLLDRAAAESLPPGQHEGSYPGGYEWTLRIDPEPGFREAPMRLLRATAEVGFTGGRSVQLTTLLPVPS